MAAKDISLVGATFYSVPQVDLPISGGGTASFVEISDTTATAADVASGKYFYTAAGVKTEGTASGGGGDSWSWAGKNPTVVKTYTDKKFLKDTAFNTWTPTTTSTKLSDAANLTAYTWSKDTYDYIVAFKWHEHFEYGSGATGKIQITDGYSFCAFDVYGYATSITYINADTTNQSATAAAPGLFGGLFYKNNLGNDTYTSSNNYGVFPYTQPTPTVSNSTITPVLPQINARCSTSIFSTTNAAAVDKDTSYYEYKIEIIQVDRGTSNNGYGKAAIRDMWLNGIS